METKESTQSTNKMYAGLKALSEAGGELVSKFEKNQEGFGYKYAGLQQFTGAIRSVFAKYDLVIFQPLVTIDGQSYIRTIIYHTSCDEPIVSSDLPISDYVDVDLGSAKKLHKGQKMGAGITYARKYAIQSILCLAPDEKELDLDSKTMAVEEDKQEIESPKIGRQSKKERGEPQRYELLAEIRKLANKNRLITKRTIESFGVKEEDLLNKEKTPDSLLINILELSEKEISNEARKKNGQEGVAILEKG